MSSKSNGRQAAVDPDGYIHLYRKILSSDVWKQGPQAVTLWIWLLLQASHGGGRQLKHSRRVLQVGEWHTTWDQMREVLRAPSGRGSKIPALNTVKALVSLWKSDRMLTVTVDRLGMVISLTNYAYWQGKSDPPLNGNQNRSLTPHQERQELQKDDDRGTEPASTAVPVLAVPEDVRTEEEAEPDPESPATWQEDLGRMWTELVPAELRGEAKPPYSLFAKLRKQCGQEATREALHDMWLCEWEPDEPKLQSYRSYLTRVAMSKGETARRSDPNWRPAYRDEVPEYGSTAWSALEVKLAMRDGVNISDFVQSLPMRTVTRRAQG